MLYEVEKTTVTPKVFGLYPFLDCPLNSVDFMCDLLVQY